MQEFISVIQIAVLTFLTKKIGPNTDPCGTPQIKLAASVLFVQISELSIKKH